MTPTQRQEGSGATKPKPICLPCWRQGVSMTEAPPREPGWPYEKCTICRRPTNNGIYVPAIEIVTIAQRVAEFKTLRHGQKAKPRCDHKAV
jgi:hypothetical protein